MRVILLGAPGAGKGSQASRLCGKYGVPHISTGEMFRGAYEKETPLGVRAHGYWGKGNLVPDDVTCSMVEERFGEGDCARGFILDGFPRTLAQAGMLSATLERLGLAVDAVIQMNVSEERILQRLTGRRVCGDCGANFHVENLPPAKPGICDNCGGRLVQRPDDSRETILNRLRVYRERTAPLIEYYRKRGELVEIDANKSVAENLADITGILENRP